MSTIPEIVVGEDEPSFSVLAPAANYSTNPRNFQGEDQNVKGGHALRALKKNCEELNTVNLGYKAEIEKYRKDIQKVIVEKNRLEDELQVRNEKIALFRRFELFEEKQQNSQLRLEKTLWNPSNRPKNSHTHTYTHTHTHTHRQEIEVLLVHETKRRKKLEQDIIDLKQELEKSKAGEMVLKVDLEFDIVELKVNLVKHSRRSDELEKAMVNISQKNDFLTHAEQTFRDENTALQKRLRELIDANREVTANYQAIKKNHDLKRNEFDDLVTELEEAKNACQLAIKQKKQMQTEMNGVIKQRQDLQEKNKALDNLLTRKEKDIADLLTKVNDTINEYELKLERKEEQMWAMSLQMTEESQKNRNTNHLNIDPDFINDIEKKWQAKEKALQAEIERQANMMRTKEESITALELTAAVGELQKKQFQPRMERLKAIEKDIKGRMEEYALAEERMEVTTLL
ncbi:hypothetical protein BDR26DRAFT_898022 [Obelidium mucronatum]|nr:hypothetical protein BDR26DRAFT_898022 [Obelidium mucronatum]